MDVDNPASDFVGFPMEEQAPGSNASIRFSGGETVALFSRFATQSIQMENETGSPT
jgi:hypothetical protein